MPVRPSSGPQWVPGLADGSMRFAFAFAERNTRYDPGFVAMTADADGDGFRLSGEKTLVLHGDSADGFVVLARTAGAAGEAAGLGLFFVPADAAGLTRRGLSDAGRHARRRTLPRRRAGPRRRR